MQKRPDDLGTLTMPGWWDSSPLKPADVDSTSGGIKDLSRNQMILLQRHRDNRDSIVIL